MKLRYLLAAAVAGMILGGGAIGLYQTIVFRRTYEELTFSVPTGTIIEEVNTLTSLRENRTDEVIQLKEEDLSRDICVLWGGFAPKIASDKLASKALRMAARYRSRHPFNTGDADLDSTVQGCLDSFRTNLAETKVDKPATNAN